MLFYGKQLTLAPVVFIYFCKIVNTEFVRTLYDTVLFLVQVNKDKKKKKKKKKKPHHIDEISIPRTTQSIKMKIRGLQRERKENLKK